MHDLLIKLNAWLVAHPVIRKPLNTFWQAFLWVVLLGISNVIDAVLNQGVDAGRTALLALIVAAGSAGLSALKTYVVEALKDSN